MKRKSIKFISAIMCLVVAVTAFAVFGEDISDLQAQIEKNEEKIGENQDLMLTLDTELAKLRASEASALEYQESLQERIDVAEENINLLETSIRQLDESIITLQEDIEVAELEYEYTLEILKERIVALYTSGTVSNLEILFNAQSLHEYSMRTQTLETIAEHDRKLMDQIKKYSEETKASKLLLEDQKSKIGDLKKNQEDEILNLENLVKENQEVISKIQATQGTIESQINTLVVEEMGFAQEIRELIQKQKELEAQNQPETETEEETTAPSTTTPESDTPDSTTQETSKPTPQPEEEQEEEEEEEETLESGYVPCWPVPGYTASYWFTRPFGNGHNGFDIAAHAWEPVVATQSGTVISAYYAWDWGNNVLIYHNDTYTTRSAHLISMAVSPGDYVEKGQVIGYVGSTGTSSGNHLHFEVYRNGTRVDPWPYISGSL